MASRCAGTRGWLTQTGSFDFACLLPGHFEAGMRGQIEVATPGATTNTVGA